MADNIGNFSSSVNTAAVTAIATGIGPGSNGVHGITSSPADSALYGEHTANGIGVFGRGGVNGGEGVFGESGTGSSGIYGKNNIGGNGVSGESSNGIGVFGISANGGAGVQGQCDIAFSAGVLGISDFGYGVEGVSTKADAVLGLTNDGIGVSGVASGPSTCGVVGENLKGVGVSGSSQNVGVRAFNYEPVAHELIGPLKNFAYLGARSFAGDFYGNVAIHGHLSKSSGSFVIDHPLDPANKLLTHSLVESNEMKNIYDGVVKLNNSGSATVKLPAWFDSVNSDCRYQLTSIGAASPNLHIKEEVKSGSFKIAGGQPNSKVSWQVTGIRKDPYALANPIQVESKKVKAERGHYLHPEVYKKGDSKSVRNARYKTDKDDKPRIGTSIDLSNLKRRFKQ